MSDPVEVAQKLHNNLPCTIERRRLNDPLVFRNGVLISPESDYVMEEGGVLRITSGDVTPNDRITIISDKDWLLEATFEMPEPTPMVFGPIAHTVSGSICHTGSGSKPRLVKKTTVASLLAKMQPRKKRK